MGRAGWGAMFAILIVATASCSSPTVKPAPSHDIQDARPIAREIGDILLTFAVYDYALIGSLNGERVRAVAPDRYAAVARAQAAVISDNTARIVAASLDTAGPVRDRLVSLADALGDLRTDALAYSDVRQADAFSRVITDVDKGWTLLRDLQGLLKDDSTLDRSIERGTAMKASVAPGAGALITIGPYADAAEAAQKAKLLGPSGVPSTTSPFFVRASYKDRASADAAAAALLKQSIVALVVDQTSFAFARSGPAPDVELWREPERSIDTHGQARRIAVSMNAGIIATGSDDGYVAIFTNDGVLRSLPKHNAGVNQLVFSDDAKFLIGGGQVLVTWVMPRPPDWVGVPVRLRNAAQSVVYVPTTNAFAASSAGDGTGGGVIGGRAPDGVQLGDPFPIEVASSGALLGASDAGDLFIATQVGGQVDLRVLHVGGERFPRGVLKVPGSLRAFAVDVSGAYGAIVTGQGTFRFSLKAADPTKTITKLGAPVRDVEFGRDGTLYLLDATKLTAVSTDGATRWTQPLIDGRRIAVGVRPVVLDGTDKLIAFGPTDGTPDVLSSVGAIGDLVASRDGKWIGVIADARRAVLFKLP
jgi:hypothetical protein